MNKKKNIFIISLIILVITAGLGIVWINNSSSAKLSKEKSSSEAIEYYTCGMHPSVKVSVSEYKKGNVNCPICNMKLIPVYKEEKKKEQPAKEKKILFYRNPMNPEITSLVAAKDQMGMDYIPVYEEDEAQADYYGCGMEGEEHIFIIKDVAGMQCPICKMPLKKLTKDEADSLRGVVSRVKIPQEERELAGVETEAVRERNLFKKIRTVGKVAYDPHLAVAEEEFISSLRAYDKIKESDITEIKQRAENLIESGQKKLKLLGLSQEQIEELKNTREVHTSLVLPAEKMWIYGEVYEYELGWIKDGQKVKVTTSALQGEQFEGIIASINPVLDPKTRSVTLRAQVDNPGLKLKPQMYVDVEIISEYKAKDGQALILAIPKDAVLDTGMRKIVWVDKGNNEYEGREILIGPEAASLVDNREVKFYPVISGVREGELVVTKANFLIDSQSQITGIAAAAYGGALEAEQGTAKSGPTHQH